MIDATKREVLLAVCENPGWAPPEPVGSSTERALRELVMEGLISSRLDGWEATGRALSEYPDFGDFPEVAAAAEDEREDLPPPLVEEAAWETVTIPTMLLRPRQKLDTEINLAQGALVGGISLVRTSSIFASGDESAVSEVEVTIRYRQRSL